MTIFKHRSAKRTTNRYRKCHKDKHTTTKWATARWATVKLRPSHAQLSKRQLSKSRECYDCFLVVRNPVTMCCLDNVTLDEKSRSGTEPRIPRQKTIFRASQLAARFPGLAVVVADVAVVAVADDDVAASQRKRCFATFWIDEIAQELFRSLHFGVREINRSDNYSKCDICIWGGGVGSAGRVVASDTRGLPFETHQLHWTCSTNCN